MVWNSHYPLRRNSMTSSRANLSADANKFKSLHLHVSFHLYSFFSFLPNCSFASLSSPTSRTLWRTCWRKADNYYHWPPVPSSPCELRQFYGFLPLVAATDDWRGRTSIAANEVSRRLVETMGAAQDGRVAPSLWIQHIGRLVAGGAVIARAQMARVAETWRVLRARWK